MNFQKKQFKFLLIIISILLTTNSFSQDYFLKKYEPYNQNIPSPEAFLEYPIGSSHTRHDLVISYLKKLAESSDRVTLSEYGKTHEKRKLIMLTITNVANHKNIDQLKKRHLEVVDANTNISDFTSLPIFINLGYNVHGNEPSGTEAALLTAYVLAASQHSEIKEYLKESIIFLDPTINPDGRDRHTNWVNTFKGSPLIADKYDIEHNEGWPRGRTNHYGFDLNRDLLLAIQPESIARLKWFHEWYPNVVTDFHEMGTNSTFFFEPKQASASLEPLPPKENYTTLNNAFAKEFSTELDKIGSLYFTKEKYDATYPGYGSTYADLQGSLALLFEQASSRGHLQETTTKNLSFSFTIKNQFTVGFATIKAAILNKGMLYKYQNNFFSSAIKKASKSKIKAYVFNSKKDQNRNKLFLDLLLKHKIKVYKLDKNTTEKSQLFEHKNSYIVPTEQAQYLMVKTLFETHKKYRDSVFYDASSWSLANAYNMSYVALKTLPSMSNLVTIASNKISISKVQTSKYAYIIPWNDYNAPALLYALQQKDIIIKTATKPLQISSNGKEVQFERGSLLIPVKMQNQNPDKLNQLINTLCSKFKVQSYDIDTGLSINGIDLGSSNFITLKKPKAMLLVEGGVSTYEAGEVWHLFEKRLEMPITKVPERIFNNVNLNRYNVIIMVSGRYTALDKKSKSKLKAWVSQGNTLITLRSASSWLIKNKLVKETLVSTKKDTTTARMDYNTSRGFYGKKSIGGAILEIDLDTTNPLGYGYSSRKLPIYKNNRIWLAPSKNKFSTVAKYTTHPHIDGYVSEENLSYYPKRSASIVTSRLGKGRVILFADNPNFRGTWLGTNKLFMNAIFFGSFIK